MGGAWNDDASPSIKTDLGIIEGCYYFKTIEEFQEFKNKLEPYKSQGIASTEEYGILTHKRTVAKLKLKYRETEYDISYDFDYEYPVSVTIFMFNQGNYSCSCNLSLFIKQQCDPDFPELDCDDEDLEILSLEIVLED